MTNENYEARCRLTAVLLPQSAPAEEHPLSASAAAKKSFGRVYKQPGMPTLEDCQEACTRIRDRFGHGESTVMLQRFGIERLVDLWAGNWRRFFNLATAVLATGIPPSSSWIEDDGVFTPGGL